MRFVYLFVFVLAFGVSAYAQENIDSLSQPEKIQLNYTTPGKYKIVDLKVVGTDQLDPQTLISLSGLKVGDELYIPGEALGVAIRKIWKQKLVADAQIVVMDEQFGEIKLEIQIKEHPRLARFTFDGVKKGEETDLKEKLNFITGQVVSDALIKNTKKKIAKYFEEKGIYRSEITIRQIKDSSAKNQVIVLFKVKKGPKVKIENLRISGDRIVSHDVYKKVPKVLERKRKGKSIPVHKDVWKRADSVVTLFNAKRPEDLIDVKSIKKKMKKTKERNPIRVFTRSKYIKDEYAVDKDKITTLLNARGFRDADLIKDSIYQIGPKRINIDIDLTVGNKYYFRNITWSGNNLHTDRELNGILNIKKGDIYNKEALDTKLNFNPNGPDISSLYMDDGYLFFSVNPVEVLIENDSIDLDMRIYEGSQATIKNVEVTGNTKTNDHVVMREIRTLPGQKFSRADLIRTQREISQLGYFDPEQIGIIPVPNPEDGTVDIEYKVVEKPSDQLQLSGGWGGRIGFVGTLGLMFSNFSLRNIPNTKSWSPLPAGDGQRLSISFQANGLFYQSYNFSFTEPWLGGKKPNSFTTSLYHTVNRGGFISNNFNTLSSTQLRESNQTTRISGGSLTLGRRLRWPDDWFTLSNSLSYTRYNVTTKDITKVTTTALCPNCAANNVAFNTTLSRNNIGNNPMFPTHGSSMTLSLALTPPYSLIDKSIENLTGDARYRLVEYHKWMFDNSWFFQLTGNNKKSGTTFDQKKSQRVLVLNARTHFGLIGRYNSNLVISPFERFKLGGSGLGFFGNAFILGTDIIGLRGYNDNSISPGGASGIGGIVYDKFVFELRYPIVISPMATIYALSFAEGGNNWGNYRDFNPFNIKRSAGMGVRIFMPAFGLIGFDWGKGFDQVEGCPGCDKGQLHFIIGQQLR